MLGAGVESVVTRASAINIEIAWKFPIEPGLKGSRRDGARPFLLAVKRRVDAVDVLVEQILVHFRTSSIQNLLPFCTRCVRDMGDSTHSVPS